MSTIFDEEWQPSVGKLQLINKLTKLAKEHAAYQKVLNCMAEIEMNHNVYFFNEDMKKYRELMAKLTGEMNEIGRLLAQKNNV